MSLKRSSLNLRFKSIYLSMPSPPGDHRTRNQSPRLKILKILKTQRLKRTHDMTTKSKQHPDPGGLVGQFFHSFHPATGRLEWQGEIIARPAARRGRRVLPGKEGFTGTLAPDRIARKIFRKTRKNRNLFVAFQRHHAGREALPLLALRGTAGTGRRRCGPENRKRPPGPRGRTAATIERPIVALDQ